MKRRFLAMLLSLAMVLTMLPVTAFAAVTKDLNITAVSSVSSVDQKTYVTLTVTKGASDSEEAVSTGLYYKLVADQTTAEAVQEPTTENFTGSEGFIAYSDKFELTGGNTYVVVAAATVNEGTVSSIDNWGIAPIKATATGLTVTAVRGDATADPEVEPVFTVTAGGEDKLTGSYYRISQGEVPTAPCVGDEITVDSSNWTLYDAANFEFTTNDKYIEVVTTTEGDGGKKLVESWGYAEITNPVAELGTLTVEVDNDNKITVTKGGETVEEANLKYYKVSDKNTFDTAKEDWTTETPLTTAEETLGTALTGATITEEENNNFIVAVETDDGSPTPNLVAVGRTDAAVTYTPAATNTVKLYEGDDTSIDLLDGEDPDGSGKYTVTVDKTTTSVKVVTTTAADTTVAVTAEDEDGTAITPSGEDNNVVAVDVGTTTITVTFTATGGGTTTYTIEVTRPTDATPTVALYEGTNTSGTNLLTDENKNGNTYTVAVDNDVEKVTVVATAGAGVTGAVTAVGPNSSAATVTGNTVELAVGKTVITVTFTDPAATYTIDVTRAEATPTVALYAGNKAEGDDLLTGKTPDASNKYTVEVENAVANVTVGKTAATDVTGTVTATGPDGNAVTFTGDTVPLAVGKTTIKVEFTDDPATVYTIEVTRKQEAKSITVKDDDATNPEDLITFVEATTEYTVMVKDDVSKVTIAANLEATITDEDGNAISSGEVSKDAGKVSNVKVTFAPNEIYTIKLVWPSDSADVDDTKVDVSDDVNTSGTTATLDLTSKVDEVLVAINNTKVVNESNSTTEPVVIKATVTDANNKKDATEVTLPVEVSDALEKNSIAASIETDVGTVTLPSEAITKAQGETAADTLKVVIKDETSSIPNDNEKEVAKFEVTVMKGANTATITGLNENPITLVFAVLASKIAGKVDPVLAWVDDTKVDGTEYKALKKCTSKLDGENTVFTAETSHLSQFAVVATADLTEEPAGTIAIAVEDADGNTIALDPAFAVNKTEYTVTTDKTSVTLKVTGVDASTVKVDGANYTTSGATVDLTTVPTEGKKVSVVYTPATGTSETYEITFKKPDTPVEQPLNVKVTDADGNPIDLDPTFDPAVGLYNVEASVSTVKIFVTGGAAGKTNVVRINNVDTPVDPNGVTVNLNDIQTQDEKSVYVVYAKGDSVATKTYKINFKNVVSQDQPLKIAVTDADGNPIDLDPAFDPAVGLYNVETSASSVKIFVTGGAAGKTNVVRINNVDTEVGPNGVPVDLSDIQTEDEKSVFVVYAKGDPLTKTYKFNFKKVAQQETESPVTGNTVTVDGSDTSLTFEAIGSEMVAKETITLSAAQNSIKMSVAAGSTVKITNAAGEVTNVTVPAAGGEITVPVTASGASKIEIVSGGQTFVINVNKAAPVTPTLTLSKEGTIGYAIIKVKISGMTAGKVYLVESAATSSGGTVKSYSVITGDSTGEAVIAISRGNVVTVEEYNSETDIANGNVDPTATSSPFNAQ